MKRIIIFGSAPLRDTSFIKRYIENGSEGCFVIAADGGLIAAKSLGLKIDYFVGDKDSLGAVDAPLEASEILPTEKDFTDLEAAVTKALSLEGDEILIFGATCGRLDHHQAALGQLEGIFDSGRNASLIDDDNEITVIEGDYKLAYDAGFRYFGLSPLDRELKAVKISGAKYPIPSPIDIKRTKSLLTSNEQLPGFETEIQIGSGRALLIRSGRK